MLAQAALGHMAEERAVEWLMCWLLHVMHTTGTAGSSNTISATLRHIHVAPA